MLTRLLAVFTTPLLPHSPTSLGSGFLDPLPANSPVPSPTSSVGADVVPGSKLPTSNPPLATARSLPYPHAPLSTLVSARPTIG